MSTSFNGKVVWVVGATGDLGRAIAIHLATQGARPVLSGRNADALAAVAQDIGAAARPLVVPVDVRDDASVRRAVDTIRTEAGGLDYLVNTTTLPLFGDLLELPDESWDAVLDTKIVGYVRTIRAALPIFIAQGHGAIVNISGRGGRQPNPVHLPGGAANAAINLITKGLADQYGDQGIRVNALAPGKINSSRLKALASVSAANHDKIGEPEDIAAGVAFLLSDAARNINGTVLAVDGGSLATV